MNKWMSGTFIKENVLLMKYLPEYYNVKNN